MVTPRPPYGEPESQAAARLIELAFAEDLQDVGDITCRSLIAPDAMAHVHVVARAPGVVSGVPVLQQVFTTLDDQVLVEPQIDEGARLQPGTVIARVSGRLPSLLTGERTALNFLTLLSGVATLTEQFVRAVEETPCVILDTRKTFPGYRALQKYAVRCGGGTNHRMGLFDGVLIKDNHLAAWSRERLRQAADSADRVICDAIRDSRKQAKHLLGRSVPVEVEVDTLEQLADALTAAPDIVLLDNMEPRELRESVALRDRVSPATRLEASGGIRLETIPAIAATGVDRISVGALTHSAPQLDIGFDWAA